MFRLELGSVSKLSDVLTKPFICNSLQKKCKVFLPIKRIKGLRINIKKAKHLLNNLNKR